MEQNNRNSLETGPAEGALFALEGVDFRYPGAPRPALEGLSFTIEKGCRLLILGSNGSGKSTLARLLTGLLLPTRGRVTALGEDTRDRAGRRKIRRGAGLLFQNPSSQIVAAEAAEDVAFGPENLALPGGEIRRRVEGALGRTGLTDLAERDCRDLSAGQQQRLALAGVLALGPGCLILDEAASMLNPSARREMDDLLEELHRRGAAVIRISHFMEQVGRADRILVLHRGRGVFFGTPEEFLGRAEHLEGWSLRPPELFALSRSLDGISPGRPTLDEAALALRLRASFPEGGRAFRRTGSASPSPDAETGPPAEAPGELLLRLDGVGYRYPSRGGGDAGEIRHLDLSFRRGETLFLMGATGSGKSTLLQLLNALLLPGEGSVSLLGENPLDKNCDLAALRSRIGLVMQQPEKQLFASLVGDDVAFGPRQMGFRGKALARRVKGAMDRMELPYQLFRDRPTRALSGGQKRKVALAGVLAMEPEILLLDEPTAGLDPGASAHLEELLLRLRREGVGLILSSHDVEQAVRFAPRLAVMARGEKVYDGDLRGFFLRRDPRAFGLVRPLAARLWEAAFPGEEGEPPLTGEALLAGLAEAAVREAAV